MRSLGPAIPALATSALLAPVARSAATEMRIHGSVRSDDYFWLRDKNDPAVMRYLEAEDEYAAAAMAPAEQFARELYDEILSHIRQTDLSVPYRLGDYWYYSRTEEGLQYPIYARKRGTLEAPEEITLDLNVLAEGHAFLGLGAYQVNDDGTLLAYALDTTGYRQYTLHVKDLRDGADLGVAIPRVGDVGWAADGAMLLYTSENDVSKRRDSFWRYRLGESGGTLVYYEEDERYDLAAGRSRDRRFMFLAAYSKATTQWWALPTADSLAPLRTIVPRRDGHRASVEHHAGRFYILTNSGAEDFRLVAAPEDTPGEEHWDEIVPEREGVHLEDLEMFERYAVLRVRSGGFSNLEVLELGTGRLSTVPQPENAHGVFPQPNPEYAADAFRFSYSSFVTPPSVYELDFATGERRLLKTTDVPGYAPDEYRSELVHAVAGDGTLVPVSLVFRSEVLRDGSAPLLLYGYGSYGQSIDPTFAAARLALLDRGVVYAVAHVRGGGELGERWRTSGHLQEKLNTFSDFIACADYLIAQRYTSSDRLAIQGASAGGLLVAAAANDRPDLFAAVVAQVPFVDVVNTMLDETLPLTTAEYLEWGNPTLEADYDYMMRYSPYDNVRAQAYPAMLVKVSVNDSQVPFWEGAKLVAKLRAFRTNDAPLLLVVNFGAGHGGASGRYDSLRETAFNYAFVLTQIAARA